MFHYLKKKTPKSSQSFEKIKRITKSPISKINNRSKNHIKVIKHANNCFRKFLQKKFPPTNSPMKRFTITRPWDTKKNHIPERSIVLEEKKALVVQICWINTRLKKKRQKNCILSTKVYEQLGGAAFTEFCKS